MGIFSKKTKTEETKDVVAKTKPAKAEKSAQAPSTSTTQVNSFGHVLIGPRITEKATMKADAENVYVFEIAQSANKITVREAVSAMYNVIPIKVAIARNPSKKVFMRGKRGVVSGVKKAYVYLKKGDKIEIV